MCRCAGGAGKGPIDVAAAAASVLHDWIASDPSAAARVGEPSSSRPAVDPDEVKPVPKGELEMLAEVMDEANLPKDVAREMSRGTFLPLGQAIAMENATPHIDAISGARVVDPPEAALIEEDPDANKDADGKADDAKADGKADNRKAGVIVLQF